jgi:hypothetical protein
MDRLCGEESRCEGPTIYSVGPSAVEACTPLGLHKGEVCTRGLRERVDGGSGMVAPRLFVRADHECGQDNVLQRPTPILSHPGTAADRG